MSTIVDGNFEWDDAKAAANLAKHGVSFEEAAAAMADRFGFDLGDALHPERNATLVWSTSQRILYVVTTERGKRTRIISARKATRHEARIYEEGP